jgi:FkbM family methyltransferase
MLIEFKYLFDKYSVKAKGVLHIGAHIGQEAEAYVANGIERVIWIEANPDLFDKLTDRTLSIPGTICINACISDTDGEEKVFHVSSNDGQSSSFLELGTHAVVHPDVTYVKDIRCTTKRIMSIFYEQGFEIDEYTFLNIDLQGAELFALRGMGGLLDRVKYAYLEVNKAELYKGCALIDEVSEYMAKFGFVLVETLWAGSTNWGDAFYIKKELLK